ncbi:hypothetical protein [Caulobacter sp. 17J65-9]|uniref:hypothetical protein n=1 Tax=Caulobacter sp. 17J65-9 TaxID=2709382 RepID=UPI0013CD477C|nr:hypothetical protein [Caulobacter sp. 17J65-9]NEX92453.1 hypothetical protein [Caulobacter sp. 17J65-9]
MKRASVAAIVLAGGLAGACASHITEVQAGMTESAVIDALGKPDTREIQGRLTELTYERHAVSGWRIRRDDYFVRLNDGKVVAFGPTDQRR